MHGRWRLRSRGVARTSEPFESKSIRKKKKKTPPTFFWHLYGTTCAVLFSFTVSSPETSLGTFTCTWIFQIRQFSISRLSYARCFYSCRSILCSCEHRKEVLQQFCDTQGLSPRAVSSGSLHHCAQLVKRAAVHLEVFSLFSNTELFQHESLPAEPRPNSLCNPRRN